MENINITIEINNNIAKITNEIAGTRLYELENWALGAAVENYVASEIICEED